MLAYYINLILFFISLFTLIYFKYNPKKYLNAVNLITYYTTQFLIASTLLFI